MTVSEFTEIMEELFVLSYAYLFIGGSLVVFSKNNNTKFILFLQFLWPLYPLYLYKKKLLARKKKKLENMNNIERIMSTRIY